MTSVLNKILTLSTKDNNNTENANLAMAALLSEVSAADREVSDAEYKAKVTLLERLLEVSTQESQRLLTEAKEKVTGSISLYDFTSHLRKLSQAERFELIKAMWEVAYSDKHIDPLEEAIIRQVADLIYVDHHEFIRAKLIVTSQ